MTHPHVPDPDGAILAVDPGSSQSAWVWLDPDRIVDHAKEANADVLAMLRIIGGTVVIEDISPRQQPLGKEVADTLRWIGRFMEAAQRHAAVHLITRQAVTAYHIDGGTKDADKRIRAAIIERYGGGNPVKRDHVLHGITADQWSALAIGLAFQDGAR